MSIDCQLKLFDNMILPILTYGSEIWGFGDLTTIEKVQTDCLKRILNVRKSTPHLMVYGELGRFLVSLHIKKRFINLWSNMLLGKKSKLLYRLYSVLYSDYVTGRYDCPWLSNVKAILKEVGENEIWINQRPINSMWISQVIELTLKDQFK